MCSFDGDVLLLKDVVHLCPEQIANKLIVVGNVLEVLRIQKLGAVFLSHRAFTELDHLVL